MTTLLQALTFAGLLISPITSFGIHTATTANRSLNLKSTHLSRQAKNYDGDDYENDLVEDNTRRNLFRLTGSTLATATALSFGSIPALAEEGQDKKVLVLGGSGFVGKEVCNQLSKLNIPYIATSRDGRDGTVAFDITQPGMNVPSTIEELSKGCTAVISCIGAIGTPDDAVINSATGLAAVGAKASGTVQNFVYISVAPEVRDSAGGIAFLQDYLDGKAYSEKTIQNNFSSSTIIEPTFIYGGDKFAINPPRVADGYGKLVEGLLSSSPFRAAARVSPGIIGIALEPPVKVSAVSKAAVAGALGLTSPVLDDYDKINAAAALI